jgi:hypothetical protein
MPKIKGVGSLSTGRVGLRLDSETRQFYEIKARAANLSLSEYLRQALMRAQYIESIEDADLALRQQISRLTQISAAGGFRESDRSSLFLVEELLKAIVTDRDVQALYRAQDKVVQRMKGTGSES